MTESNVFLKSGDKLVIATHNKGKLSEFQAELSKVGLIAISLADFTSESPEETADSFEGNAKIKAIAAAKATDLPSLADDSGFCVNALEGRPGLYSGRWAEQFGTMPKALVALEEEVRKSSKKEKKGAYFIAALCLALPDGRTKTVIGKCEGTISFPPKGEHGHGYDPVFVPNGHHKTFAEMPSREKNKLSHRGLALEKFLRECVEC
ncbi:RdgB/HAM1 family non-canonical purine NTP pyrophosphatase [Acetobacteraceae bacterium]|nr:RdgB/HAM1 family non-canonical purine NTP pyrophosphatase [Acetobacteraceae bacterium]